tara:strand:+ start:4745 stop:6016 length:1272 start_codon:yes stop_codon:yes gene_type:complete
MKNKKQTFKKKLDSFSNKLKEKLVVRDINYIKQKLNDLNTSLLRKINTTKSTIPTLSINELKLYFKNKIFKDNNEAFLKQDNFWIRSVSWGIIGTSLFGIGWLAIAKTEEIIVVPGKIVPIGEVKNIQMPMGGIANKIFVKEGQIVAMGDKLIELDNELILERDKTLRKSILLKTNEQEIYKKLNLEEQNMLFNIKELDGRILSSLASLKEEGAISKLEYLKQELKLQESESNFNQSKIQFDRQNSIYQSELADLKGNFAQNRVTLKNMLIKSPVNGVVFDLKPTTSGYSAQMTETILKIVPLGELEARIEIPSKDIGFVSEGMNVDISIDSFPASDFGVIKGHVSRIGSDALQKDQTQSSGLATFPASVKLDYQKLLLKDQTSLDLKVGMSLNANVKLRKVSYLQLLLTTFKNKTDSLKELQ